MSKNFFIGLGAGMALVVIAIFLAVASGNAPQVGFDFSNSSAVYSPIPSPSAANYGIFVDPNQVYMQPGVGTSKSVQARVMDMFDSSRSIDATVTATITGSFGYNGDWLSVSPQGQLIRSGTTEYFNIAITQTPPTNVNQQIGIEFTGFYFDSNNNQVFLNPTTVVVSVSAANDTPREFNWVAPTPNPVSVAAGQQSQGITFGYYNGTSRTVTMSLVPSSGFTVTPTSLVFNPNSNGTKGFNVTAATNAPTSGAVTLTVPSTVDTGSSPHTRTVNVTVTAGAQPFTLSANPTPITVDVKVQCVIASLSCTISTVRPAESSIRATTTGSSYNVQLTSPSLPNSPLIAVLTPTTINATSSSGSASRLSATLNSYTVSIINPLQAVPQALAFLKSLVPVTIVGTGQGIGIGKVDTECIQVKYRLIDKDGNPTQTIVNGLACPAN